MSIKEYFDSLSLDDLQEFVNQQFSEDLHIEFKTANFPREKVYDDKNFSKCLSGFANSSGGIIIWGIEAKKNKHGVDTANSLKPVKDVVKFENQLKRMEGTAVIPLIEGVEYRRINSSIDDGFILVYVPPSERAPHMAQFADKHYYKRSGDSFYMCEHFDIIDMINRRITPNLIVEIHTLFLVKQTYNKILFPVFHGIICIGNVGQIPAKHLELHLKVNQPFKMSNYGINGNNHRGMKLIPTRENYYKYVGGIDLVLHPETEIEVDKVILNEIRLEHQLDDLLIEYKIMAEGMKIKSGEIKMSRNDLNNISSA